ncbi:MAG: HesA/MoeB/ThiF family protein, partial [Desulfomonilia bacterium]|nr:HesA/MoeB/ThiF family protein [Desulfomonilia bacterium]
MTLSHEQRHRYTRQLEILGEEGQRRLGEARVLITGLGGLGSIIAGYLAVSGIGYLRIVDIEQVEATDLNRQLFYVSEDIGRDKTESLAKKLVGLNPFCRVDAHMERIDEKTIHHLVNDIHIIVDTLDNFTSRHVLNRVAVTRRLPLVHGAVRGLYGHALTVIPGRSACLKCIFPERPPHGIFPILGPTCGVIASVQASEVIKYATGIGSLLLDRLFAWNGRLSDAEIIDVERNPECSVCGYIPPEVA